MFIVDDDSLFSLSDDVENVSILRSFFGFAFSPPTANITGFDLSVKSSGYAADDPDPIPK